MNIEPELEFRPEIDIPAEIPITCEVGLGATRPSATDIADQADTPEVVISQGITRAFNRKIFINRLIEQGVD